MKATITFEENDLSDTIRESMKQKGKKVLAVSFHYDAGDQGDPRGNTTRIYAEVVVEDDNTRPPPLYFPPGVR